MPEQLVEINGLPVRLPWAMKLLHYASLNGYSDYYQMVRDALNKAGIGRQHLRPIAKVASGESAGL